MPIHVFVEVIHAMVQAQHRRAHQARRDAVRGEPAFRQRRSPRRSRRPADPCRLRAGRSRGVGRERVLGRSFRRRAALETGVSRFSRCSRDGRGPDLLRTLVWLQLPLRLLLPGGLQRQARFARRRGPRRVLLVRGRGIRGPSQVPDAFWRRAVAAGRRGQGARRVLPAPSRRRESGRGRGHQRIFAFRLSRCAVPGQDPRNPGDAGRTSRGRTTPAAIWPVARRRSNASRRASTRPSPRDTP